MKYTFVDLGVSPLANSYVSEENILKSEVFYPLHVFVCEKCYLVQLPLLQSPEEIFSDYAYFSSYSDSWLEHARKYSESMIERYLYNANSLVMEIASNDGYLLQYFRDKGIPVLGIEPAANVATYAEKAGIPTLVKFFGTQTAKELINQGTRADLLIGNNVLAHVPDMNDFVRAMKMVLKPDGIITMEFPHLLKLVEKNQFDTIYHEHYSYLSFSTIKKVFEHHGLTLFDVSELPTHGGSLRIFACHKEDRARLVTDSVSILTSKEHNVSMNTLDYYLSFSERAKQTKRNIWSFFIRTKSEGKLVVGYGAPAKGNTLLNYCGIRTDFLEYTVDRSPHKQGRYLPGTRIPIYHPDHIAETKPDYVVILPWNLQVEIMEQMSHIRDWGGRFVTLIPEVTIHS